MSQDRHSEKNMAEFRLMMSGLDPRPEHNLNNLLYQVEKDKQNKKQNTQDKK